MKEKYAEYKSLNLPSIDKEILKFWEESSVFEKSVETRKGKREFVFYEGPPSANGLPGIHHVMARAIKDIFCRYRTLKGYLVKRKAGWDTHGLPIEIAVEKTLGITKDDIGKKISIVDYNNACRKDVMKYKDKWDDITIKLGFWLDLENPYITFDNKYIETVWYLLKELYKKGLLYKGYSIQPYSPAAGTGLSTHELNQPGCYKNVKDTTIVAQFKILKNEHPLISELFKNPFGDVFFLAWTTTPWTLPSNTALAVGKNIDYVAVKTFNQYNFKPVTVILAKELMKNFFPEKNAEIKFEEYQEGQKEIPYEIIGGYKGSKLDGIRYEQLMPYAQPTYGDAFRVVIGDFVSTEDGTGIVHIAPSFGADDFRMSKIYGLGSLTMVDKKGKFIDAMGEFAGKFVKNEYKEIYDPKEKTIDVDIAIKLKEENKAFKIEKYEHSYPHCWRTDKPILYYPLDSWFVKTTAMREKMMELNNTINWKPESTGTGRFGNWLENMVDWNLSRSRYWGVPLPVWRSENGEEEICIGSVAELKEEIEKSIKAGFMKSNPLGDFAPDDFSKENYKKFDLHRPFADEIILVSKSGKKMLRELDLIDVWFDSGSMPYAQFHYPFENKNLKEYFPADFIAEGVDQTRGWFYTLHAIAAMVFGSVAYKTVVSNGLVLDKNGNKMSKRLGNAVNPFETIEKYGADATRWYMITNAQVWDNLKFDIEGIGEIQRKFFGTLYNTYAFFALYANIDNFKYTEEEIPVQERPEIDQWIISTLNSLIKEVDEAYFNYEATKAGRAIQYFLDEHLSNWYVRLCRRRFWKGDYSKDKIAAYQTLYKCLEVVAQLSSPIAPFFMERIFCDLNETTGKQNVESIHLTDFPVSDKKLINKELEEKMEIAQKVSSMVLSLRKKVNIRVRQPLSKILIPATDKGFIKKIKSVENLVLSETNLKELEIITDIGDKVVKKIKPNFKTLGPKFGKQMKDIANAVNNFSQVEINKIETEGKFEIKNLNIEITSEDVEITTDDIPGWLVTNDGSMTVALDITITEKLLEEGIAREMVNRIQNLRKDSGFDVTDKIILKIKKHDKINSAIKNNLLYICTETLTATLDLVDTLDKSESVLLEIDDNTETLISIKKNK
ncbi:MAG: isoleucine--tRNA ligase [Bacteroidales bacterium]|nr:isoleucine--tRNA ligase [Bacteroidales bacterium]